MSNSDFPGLSAKCITIDDNGTKWIGTVMGGLAAFDGSNWTIYNTTNSNMPSNSVNSIAIDNAGTKWVGTAQSVFEPHGGLASFDGSDWTIYNTSNSGLPENVIMSLAIDEGGNKWVGTQAGGLAVFNEGGIVVGINEDNQNNGLITDFRLHQNFPNPFNPSTTIRYALPEVSNVLLVIYDLRGNVIQTLESESKPAGWHEDVWNGVDESGHTVPTGLYLAQLRAGSQVETIKMLYLK